VSIAGVRVSVSGGSADFLRELAARYAGFAVEGDSAAAAVVLSISETDPNAPDADPESEVVVTRDGDLYRIASDEFACSLDLAEGRGEASMRPHDGVFDSFLRVLYSALLVRDDGFLVHAAGLERDGAGYLFPGPSSSGKTTLAGQAQGFRVLSDELTAVKMAGGAFRAFSTPFGGELEKKTAPIAADLKAVFFLDATRRKGDLASVEGGPAGSSVSLMENVFFFLRDADSSRAVLELCCDLSMCVPCYRTGFLDGGRIGEIVGDI
jgi:hypothetical protein